VQRLLCQIAHIDSQKLRTGQINSDEEWTRLTDACDKLYSAPIYIDDTPGISVAEMRSKSRKLKSERGLDLIVVDYLQLMTGRNSESRQQEISEISRSLKALARELKVPLIALSQLSRSVESRQDKRPMLSDLRESGALEQDADIVSFLYREDYYDKETENQHITEVILAKHRNGPVGSIKLYFKGEFTLFLNLDTTHGGGN
jgi:replicative DNA helicase